MEYQVFTDGEVEIIAELKAKLPLFNADYSNIFIGVKKPVWADKAIIVRSDGGPTSEDGLLKVESFGINIFVEGKAEALNYEYISPLTNIVISIIENLKKGNNSFKSANIKAGARSIVTPQLEGEQRYFTFSSLRLPKTINI